MVRTLLLFLPALAALAQSQPSRQVTSQAKLIGHQPVPGFQNGYLFLLERDVVRLYSPEGFPLFATVVQVPSSVGQPSSKGLAVDTDGSVAVSTLYQTSNGFGGGISFFDRNGQPTEFIDTGRYMPGNLSFGEDHSLWVFGWQRDALQPKRTDSQDYMTVRHYSSDHKEEGRYLPRSLFPEGLEPGTGSWQTLRIAVAHDRVGLLAWSGMNSGLREWVELAFTADGHLYRWTARQPNLQVLDQTTADWRDAGPAPGPRLWGADGNSLVFSPTPQSGPIVLQWFDQPAREPLAALPPAS